MGYILQSFKFWSKCFDHKGSKVLLAIAQYLDFILQLNLPFTFPQVKVSCNEDIVAYSGALLMTAYIFLRYILMGFAAESFDVSAISSGLLLYYYYYYYFLCVCCFKARNLYL